jgi:DNA-binding NarL/FixJ family response regulator
LVVAGLTNKEIADRLVVSVRTVEGHLYRACTKLDISDREKLVELIREVANASNNGKRLFSDK